METTDYCSYELSKALKSAGFDEPCNYGYSVKLRLEPEVSFGEPKMVHSKDPKNYNDNRKGIEKGLEFCSAVSLWQAQKWLREKKEIFVEVTSEALHDWDFFVMELDEDANVGVVRGSEIYPSYEQALSAGISAALELIKPAHQ